MSAAHAQDGRGLNRVKVLLIEGCKDPLLWYAHHVGQYVPLEGVDVATMRYRSREATGFTNFVRMEDAKPITVLLRDAQVGRWPFTARAGTLAEPEPEPVPEQARSRGQSRAHSAIETAVNIGVGFAISLVITAVVMPWFGHHVTAGQNLAITSIFTVASVARSYALRRLFNRWSVA